MNSRIKSLSICVLMITVLFYTFPAYSESGGFCDGKGPDGQGKKGMGMHDKKGKMMDAVMEEIGLTEEQQSKLAGLRESQKEGSRAIRSEMRAKHEEMKNELDKPVSDNKKVEQLVNDMTDLYRQKTNNRVKGVLDIKSVLTPEQFQLLNEKMEAEKKTWKGSRKQRRSPQEQRGEGQVN